MARVAEERGSLRRRAQRHGEHAGLVEAARAVAAQGHGLETAAAQDVHFERIRVIVIAALDQEEDAERLAGDFFVEAQVERARIRAGRFGRSRRRICGRQRAAGARDRFGQRDEQFERRLPRSIGVALIANRAAVLRQHEIRQRCTADRVVEIDRHDLRRDDLVERSVDRLFGLRRIRVRNGAVVMETLSRP